MSIAFLNIDELGKQIGQISVVISYKIIDRFSGHLYSSPSKAIEELVVNAYDAFATKCQVYIPLDLDEKNASIVVYDDGDGMDETDLEELWLIADSRKRDNERESSAKRRGRLPVGKFGIGKLASYVIGKRIIHITRKEGRYLAVTMDYRKIEDYFLGSGSDYENSRLSLPIINLEFSKILDILKPVSYTHLTLPTTPYV